MTQFFNRTTEKAMRQQLRKAMPKAEILLWSRLRGKQVCGHKFRRQYSVGPYSIDFYCPAAKLAIELDGDSHFHPSAQRHDSQRQRYIESFGIRCLRFTNSEVYENLGRILETIALALRDITTDTGEDTPLNPSFARGEAGASRAGDGQSTPTPLDGGQLTILPLRKRGSEGVL